MTLDHILLQLGPRAWARSTLDQVRAGRPVPLRWVRLALFFSGDLPRYTKGL